MCPRFAVFFLGLSCPPPCCGPPAPSTPPVPPLSLPEAPLLIPSLRRVDGQAEIPVEVVAVSPTGARSAPATRTVNSFDLPGVASAPNPADGAANEPTNTRLAWTPGGGAVFSASSITWAASLAHEGYDNNVARLSENVVRRFLDETPFVPPPLPTQKTQTN